MSILLRIIKMAWRYRVRLILAYLSFFAAIGFALLIPRLFGSSVDRLVRFDSDRWACHPLAGGHLDARVDGVGTSGRQSPAGGV